ncbi:lysophospholipid acyltransferase 5 [Galleria mellonella]|uniref:Lysophospholipid acyltransferase 5 n=1 Tax=Galleria mellonella TaxID=7137 RepID=A0A6J1X287_GALME|nr:lysophospholipid acyltransferase 5 [Galleria mellonella]XP_026759709.1 lysophospholipid acyltransferase 5 [Galleria mellonella]
MLGLLLATLGWIGCSPVPYIASMIGATEPALKLLVSILMGYPLAIIYHKYVRMHKQYRNIYFIITGVDIAFYNFGASMYHNLIPAIVIYLSTKLLGPGKMNALVSFVFNMTYLLVGYVVTESEEYDITWTMPHCVLTLKLIALSYDLWDGQLMIKGEKLSDNNKKTALPEAPTFLELIGFLYFPACFLVGPIFSFRRYKDFISDKFPLNSEARAYERQGFYRLIQGIIYMIAFQIGGGVFSMKYMLSDEFSGLSVLYRHLYCGLWGHFALYKYVSCWLLTEASCIRFGLSYNGSEMIVDGISKSKWDGCNNIKLLQFECATKFQHYIDSFNCNTNYFAAEYVYKRLKFLGNRHLSQFFTLLFLALWHGIRSGYYVTFFNEFIIIYMEKELEPIIKKTVIYQKWSSNIIVKWLVFIILKLYALIYMGWSLVPFDVKVYSKWFTVYSSLYFSGFLLFLPWTVVYKPIILSLIKVNRPKSQ